MAEYRKMSGETKSVFSNNHRFRTKTHCVAIYEQTKKGLCYVYSKRTAESDKTHTLQLKV